MNAKAKGTRNEHRSRALLEAQGYAVTRAASSLGLWDLVGVSQADCILVQAKSNRWPSRAERTRLLAFPCPTGTVKVLHRWRDGERQPDRQEL